MRSWRLDALVVLALAASCAPLPASERGAPVTAVSAAGSTSAEAASTTSAPLQARQASATTAAPRTAVLGELLGGSALWTSSWAVSGTVVDAGQPSGAIAFTGVVDAAAGASSVRVDLDARLQSLRDDPALGPEFRAEADRLLGAGFEVVTIGEVSWLRWAGLHQAGGEPSWVEGNPQRAEALTGELGFGSHAVRPLWLLAVLADAAVSVEELGADVVGGRSTEHLRVSLDVPSVLAGLDSTDLIAVLGEVGPGDRVQLELWVDGNGVLRRFGYERFGDGDLATAPTGPQVAVVVELSDPAAAVAVARPEPAIALDEVLAGSPTAGERWSS